MKFHSQPIMFLQVMVLTGEGGRLRRNVMLSRGRDFEVVPEPVWRALQQWYQGGPPLPRSVRACSALACHPMTTGTILAKCCGLGLGLTNFYAEFLEYLLPPFYPEQCWVTVPQALSMLRTLHGVGR